MLNKRGDWNTRAICIILMLLAGVNWRSVNAGVAEGLTEGIKYAGQMFGINTAADVADLVAKAFSNAATTAQKKPDLFSTLFQRRPKPATTYSESEEEDILKQESQHENHASSHEKIKEGTSAENENPLFNVSGSRIILGVLRMIGFDARKLGALALNALVMMTQAIANTLLGAFTKKKMAEPSPIVGGRLNINEKDIPNRDFEDEPESETESDGEYRPRKLRSGSPVDWYLENPTDEMKELLSYAMDKKLPDYLVGLLEDVEAKVPNKNVACVKMLMCKSSPFIWGMQKSVEKRIKGENYDEDDDIGKSNSLLNTSVFYKVLPTLNEYRQHSSICDQRYRDHCRKRNIPQKKDVK